MKKVVKLKESDLINIIKKVVKEQSSLTTTSTTPSKDSSRKRCCRPQKLDNGHCNIDCNWFTLADGTCYCGAAHFK